MFAIFDQLGGQDAVLAILRQNPLREGWPTKDTIKKWNANRELPGQVIKRLMSVCDERGIPYEMSDFRRSIPEPAAPQQDVA